MNDQFHYKLTTSEFSTIVRRFIGSNNRTKCNRNVFNNGESGMHAFISVFTVASDPSNSLDYKLLSFFHSLTDVGVGDICIFFTICYRLCLRFLEAHTNPQYHT